MSKKIEQPELFPVNGENQLSKYKLPKGWKLVSLGYTLESTQYGITTSSSQGNYRMFRMNNFASGKMSPDNVVSVDVSDEEAKRYILRKGDILFNRTNSYELVGKTGIFDLEGVYIFASYLVRLNVDKSKASPEFINYFLNSPAAQTKLKVIATKGVSQANINPTNLQKDIILLLPPLPEQRKIAAILDTWDTAIDTIEKLIAAKEQLKQGLMQRLRMGRLCFVAENTHEAKPQALENLVSKVYNGGTPSTQIKAYWEGEIPWITGADIVDYSVATIRRSITKEAVDNSATNVVPKDCILVVTRTGVGKMTIASREIAISQDITAICADSSKIEYQYLFYYLLSTVEAIAKLTQGTSINGITRDVLMQWRIKVPSLHEQQKIASVLSVCDHEIQLLKTQLAALKHQKKGLMQQLLTGRVRVKVEEDKSVVAV